MVKAKKKKGISEIQTHDAIIAGYTFYQLRQFIYLKKSDIRKHMKAEKIFTNK